MVLQETNFNDAPSSGAMVTASIAARKFFSRLTFRDNKSASPDEDNEASVGADREETASSPTGSNEESHTATTKGSGEDINPPNAGNSDLLQGSKLESGAPEVSPKPEQRNAKEPESSAETTQKPDTSINKSAKPAQPNKLSHTGPKEMIRPKKPSVKVKPQMATATSPPAGQQLSNTSSDEKMKRELSSPSEAPTFSSSSSSSLSSSSSHVSNATQRMQNSQASQQLAANSRVSKPTATAATIPGPTYPHGSVPGPVKPRPPRRTAPSSHPRRTPRPLSTPNMDDSSSLTLLTSSLPGLQTECSKEELQLMTELQQKATANDYYGLLGVDPEATMEELARARRDRTRVLHPDHFANDPERQAK